MYHALGNLSMLTLRSAYPRPGKARTGKPSDCAAVGPGMLSAWRLTVPLQPWEPFERDLLKECLLCRFNRSLL